jgi:chaperonin GroES
MALDMEGQALIFAALALSIAECQILDIQKLKRSPPGSEVAPMATATKAKPSLKIQPLEDRVVIMPSDEAETMRGGLYIPDTAKEKPTQGEVIAVGPGRVEKGDRVPMDLKVGDNVIYGKYSGSPFQLGGDEVIIIKASDVLAKIS